MKVLKSLNDCVDESLTHKGENEYFACDFIASEENESFKVDEASICNRDILLFSDKATLNYLVDIYGDKTTIELFNIDY